VFRLARPTVAEIRLSALRHNCRTLQGLLPAGASLFGVVKANGYGHGAVPVAKTLFEAGASMLGIASVEEGIELREAAVSGPALVLGDVDADVAAEAHAHGLSAVLFRADQVDLFARVGRAAGRPFPVHVKVDTGMGRLGFFPGEAGALIDRLRGEPGIAVEGFMTHLASADGHLPDDREFTLSQLRRFEEVAAAFRDAFPGVLVHALNSAGLLAFKDFAFDMARPGIALYGSLPAEGLGASLGLEPVMRLVSRIVSLKRMPAGHPVSYGRLFSAPEPRDIAVVPIGYADGYHRGLTGSAWMGVEGRRAPVAGRVCMDMTMIDVTGIPGVRVGSEVVIMGDGGPTADVLAPMAGTIPYELLTQVGRRIPRRPVA
jgi:alanine racemase